jgi:hypothetical protein
MTDRPVRRPGRRMEPFTDRLLAAESTLLSVFFPDLLVVGADGMRQAKC